MIDIFTDGAYNPGLNRGGWAAVLAEDGQKRALSGSARKTTSNRMELTAALEGILSTPQHSEVTLYTDSQYLFNTMTRGWQKRANRDLWQKLDDAVTKRSVHWEWIRGDDSSPFHKEAHALATNLASGAEKPSPKSLEEHIQKARMVDVSPKPVTQREAIARGVVRMKPATLDLIRRGGIAKGDVLAVAQIAGVMAAKQTPSLIPLCHPLLVEDIEVRLEVDDAESSIKVAARVKGEGKTGMEMEALVAAAISALSVYDMCKAVDPAMSIELRLVRKSGGKSGTVELEPDLS